MKDKNCKICGCSEQNKLFELCSSLKLMGKHFPNSPSMIVECPNCGFVYIDTEATQEDFNKYYSSPSSNPFSYYELYGIEHTENYFNDILSNFKDYINHDSDILDFAGGSGDFAKFLLKEGYKNVSQLEISAKCAEIAKTKGVRTILKDGCSEGGELKNKFDLITMIHSLEHFKDIDKLINSIKKMLKPEGLLYIEVPDAEKYSDRDSVPFTMFTFEHLYHFTKETMQNISNVFGLEKVDIGQFYKAESYDVLYGLYKNNGKILNPEYSSNSKDKILKYNTDSFYKLKPYIEQFEKTQEKLILWGIGASTVLLLNNIFDNCNVIQLIDRNKQRQGLSFKIGDKMYSVQDPDNVEDDSATIVVLPYWYHDSIIRQIKDMGFKNPVKSLIK